MSEDLKVILTYVKPLEEIKDKYGNPPHLYSRNAVFHQDVLDNHTYTIINENDVKQNSGVDHIFTITDTSRFDIRNINAHIFNTRGFAYVNVLDEYYNAINTNLEQYLC